LSLFARTLGKSDPRGPCGARSTRRRAMRIEAARALGACRGSRRVALALILLVGCVCTLRFSDADGRAIPGGIARMETLAINGIDQSD